MGKFKKSIQELELENRIPIDAYFNKYVVGKKKGVRELSDAQTTSICPFHDENDPSMHYWVSRKMIHCFGCGVTANIVSLHQLVQRRFYGNIMDRPTAMNDLIRLYGLQTVIKDAVAVEEAEMSVFDKCRAELTDRMNRVSTPDTFTISRYRTLNNNIMNMPVKPEVKIREFENIDLLACLEVGDLVEHNA